MIFVFVCNYTASPICINELNVVLQPGPNLFSESKAKEIMKYVDKESVGTAKSIEDVDWASVPEPWRLAYYRAYGDRIFRKARLRELQEKEQALGKSVAKMNKAMTRVAKARV
ncbi:MAG: hypothetical protein QW793_04900 [Candidatus Caldarchaeum sp.]